MTLAVGGTLNNQSTKQPFKIEKKFYLMNESAEEEEQP